MQPTIDPERYQRVRDEAMARALELRRRAIDDAWDRFSAALRRVMARRPLVESTAA